MNRIKAFVTIVAAILLMCVIVAGQSRSRSRAKVVRAEPAPTATPPATAKRPVTIKLKQGEPVTGYFLRADANAVQVEVNRRTVAIKLNEVDSLQFASEEVQPAKPAEEPPAKPAPTPDVILQNARKAYAALLKLSEASKIGLPYLPYANLLIEVRPVIDESLAALPEGALKGDIAAAMEAYTEAGQAWSAGLGKGVLPIATEPGASLMRKYSIKPAVNALGQEDRLMLDATLGAIWMAAGIYLNNVAVVIKR